MTIEQNSTYLFGLIDRTRKLPVGTRVDLYKSVSHRAMLASFKTLEVLSPDKIKIIDGTCGVWMTGHGTERMYEEESINRSKIKKERTDFDILTTRHTQFTWKP